MKNETSKKGTLVILGAPTMNDFREFITRMTIGEYSHSQAWLIKELAKYNENNAFYRINNEEGTRLVIDEKIGKTTGGINEDYFAGNLILPPSWNDLLEYNEKQESSISINQDMKCIGSVRRLEDRGKIYSVSGISWETPTYVHQEVTQTGPSILRSLLK